MTHSPPKRGIPAPGKTLESVRDTVEALKESVESNAQGLRDRELYHADRDKAVEQMNANKAGGNAEERLKAIEKQLADHEARITALEP